MLWSGATCLRHDFFGEIHLFFVNPFTYFITNEAPYVGLWAQQLGHGRVRIFDKRLA